MDGVVRLYPQSYSQSFCNVTHPRLHPLHLVHACRHFALQLAEVHVEVLNAVLLNADGRAERERSALARGRRVARSAHKQPMASGRPRLVPLPHEQLLGVVVIWITPLVEPEDAQQAAFRGRAKGRHR